MSEEAPASEVVSQHVEVTSNEELSGPPAETSTQEDKPSPPANAENGTKEDKKSEPSSSAPAAPIKPKYRHDWYQTASDVYVNVMIKKLNKDQVHVEFGDTTVSYERLHNQVITLHFHFVLVESVC